MAASIRGEIVISRPISEVFDFVADERNEPKYNPRMLRAEKLTDGAIGTGTQFRATMKSRRTPDMVLETTEYDRPTRLASTTTMPSAEIRGVLTFEPTVGGTRLRWSFEVQPNGALKALRPIIVRVGRRQEATNWASLKRYLESTPTVGTAASPSAAR
ncbi:SRPBCC family protein [Pengzhenrongella frigida]|uniref:SRPBCC family protein n=1 Tax=Pengzhenrongella frigida TaxID=1259133 RepID=A0A4Q5MWG1_9MICO|nr:SRPBCC family protein [Cellulomonas sp. HLT2-17]RYV49899.1 hypothetical protein EUA98_16485 [Cellulomonas sp. HLT2-17]